jgi:protein ImuB
VSKPGAELETGRVIVLRCPELGGGDGAGEHEAARAFEGVVRVVTGFCPAVEVVEPGVCAFAARGPARYFGGEAVVASKIIAAVAELGVRCRIGVAGGLFAAGLAARAVPRDDAHDSPREDADDSEDVITVIPAGETAEFLGRQPVSVLADAELAGLLVRLGIPTLAGLAALPARHVASRFGERGLAAHRLARGDDPRPLAARPSADDLSVTEEFDPPEISAEPLVFAAKALAERMHAGLAARGLTCVRVRVSARWEDGAESDRLWRHDGLLTSVQIADRVRWQLDGWRAPERTPEPERAETGGIVLLRLVPDQVVRATGQQLALWGEAVVTDRVARAAMRVQALLGHEGVLRPVLSGGRNVAEQVTQRPFWEKEEPRFPKDRPWPGQIPGAAPACVFPEPREALVTDDGGQIVTVSGRCVVSGIPATLTVATEPSREITGWAGPWPLAERWWDADAASRRARFQLVTGDGRAWLAVVRDGRWQVEAGYW